MTQSLGRVQIIKGSPPALPGKCSVCGTTDTQETYIDIGLDLDFYGVVYFCSKCIVEIANALEYHSPGQWKMIKELNNLLRLENNALKDENGELKNVLSSVGNIRNISNTISSIDSTLAEINSKSGESIQGTDTSNTKRKGGSLKSSDGKRSGGLYHDDSIESLLGETI